MMSAVRFGYHQFYFSLANIKRLEMLKPSVDEPLLKRPKSHHSQDNPEVGPGDGKKRHTRKNTHR